MTDLTSLEGLLTDDDADELRGTFDEVVRAHNEREDPFAAAREALENWSGDLPEHFFF